MSYSYDIFVSYARDDVWDRWVKDFLKALLRTFLLKELGREPAIFIDREMAPASDWPAKLGTALGSARVLIAILDSSYFSSQYCLHELDLMLGRLSEYPGCRLIIPIIGHNCDNLPDPVSRITLLRDKQDFKEFYNPYMQDNTKRFFDFSEKVKDLAPDIAAAVRSAPAFDSNWVKDCTQRISALYHAGEESSVRLIYPSLIKVAYEQIDLPGASMR